MWPSKVLQHGAIAPALSTVFRRALAFLFEV
jgi:hypothetical protein